jgi:cytoskeletal protein CcmA (bactofilin family)
MASALRITLIFLLGLTGPGLASLAVAQEAGERVIISEGFDRDLYAAGEEVIVESVVAGDAVLAAGTVLVNGDVRDDVLAAGRYVNIAGGVGDDVRLAGEVVTVSGNVLGHAAIAASEVRITKGAWIRDWAWLAGSSVLIDGGIGGDLLVAGSDVRITGDVRGDADIIADRIHIGDGAVINGDLTWRSENEPIIDDTVVIRGEIIRGELPDIDEGDSLAWRLLAMLSVVLAAGVLFTLFRSHCESCAALLEARPGISLLLGLVVFATVPLVTALLFATAIGAVLGVLLLMTYGIAILLGFLTGIVALARLGLRWRRGNGEPTPAMTWLAIAVVGLVIGILGPLGFPVGFFLMLFGLGVLTLHVKALRG